LQLEENYWITGAPADFRSRKPQLMIETQIKAIFQMSINTFRTKS
jgi:hypothetical protein